MLVSELYPSQWLNAADLNGKFVTVEIQDVRIEEVGSSRDEKPVIRFVHHSKRLILNKTNMKTIAALHGDNIDLWTGKKVTLYPTTTPTADGDKPCIRIKEPPDYVPTPTAETSGDPGWKPDGGGGNMDDEIEF